jgi:hypothetical protein
VDPENEDRLKLLPILNCRHRESFSSNAFVLSLLFAIRTENVRDRVMIEINSFFMPVLLSVLFRQVCG